MPRPIVSFSILDASRDIVCGLDADLRIVYCNSAWNRFALENDGETCCAAHVIGTRLLDVAPPPLSTFYRTVFETVLATEDPFEFDYECSSQLVFRQFRMRVLPVSGAASFLVIHSLHTERPHDREAMQRDEAKYRSSAGLVIMCCHCRRTRRAEQPNTWDWVPHYVAHVPPRVSVGICPACYAYFYPEIYAQRAAKGRG